MDNEDLNLGKAYLAEALRRLDQLDEDLRTWKHQPGPEDVALRIDRIRLHAQRGVNRLKRAQASLTQGRHPL